VRLFDGGTQIGTGTLAAGMATFTISSLAVGSHSLTAQYSGDPNNAASTSAALIQTVNVPTDSIKLRAMQVSVTPMIAQLSGQAIVGAIESAIDAGFSENPQALTPNGAGFTFQTPLGQSAATPTRGGGNGTERRVQIGAGTPGNGTQGAVQTGPGTPGNGTQVAVQTGPGSLANGLQGGNGAPFGIRLIDMAVIPLPPGSGMPANGETQMSQTELVVQFGFGTTPQQIGDIAQRFGLTVVEQQTIGVLGRPVYTFSIPNGQSVREVIGRVQAAGLNLAVQPKYNYRLTQDRSNPNADQGDPAQYIVSKFHFAELHRITKGARAIVAVIDSQIDANQPNLAGTISDRYDAGCDASSPHPHGTGMAGAIAAHGQLVGVAPQANIIAVCAFGGGGQAEATTMNIIKGLDYAIQRGARIVNMSFAGPRDPALAQVLQIAREKGILVIAAAGNGGPKALPLYPGADPNVMAVTATDENDRLFNGANQGKYVTVAAPGVDILVPAPNETAQLTTGTSVATANVSGVAALLIARRPSLTPEQIRAILVKTAKHLGSRGINPQFGSGLVDPLKALELEVSYLPEQDDVRRFLAAPDASSQRVEDGFAALGYAPDERLLTKAPPPLTAPSRDWLAWIDVRGTDFSRSTFGSDLKGGQVNAIAGLTHKFTPNFLVGDTSISIIARRRLTA
jgi:subtilisin family serine protease